METPASDAPDVKFSARQCTPADTPLAFDGVAGDELKWISVLEASVSFGADYFNQAIEENLFHPERNTSLILRAEILSDGAPINAPQSMRHIALYNPTRNLVRRLLPRQRNRDPSLDQDCTFFTLDASSSVVDASEELDSRMHDASPLLVILSPRLDNGSSSLPWYHPPVRHLAFRYLPQDNSRVEPSIRIEVVLADAEQDSGHVTDPSSRLNRTCLALLETICRYGKGKMNGYKKRVVHDTLVPREEYQDLYMLMRDHFKDIADTWVEATDASKHVFEDISIATFLILLWKYTYPAPAPVAVEDPKRPWVAWGKPPHGFLDFGCGNGLLVHILIECGYDGLGVDLRARKSWPHYPPATRSALHVHAFDPNPIDARFLLDEESRRQATASALASNDGESEDTALARAMFPDAGGRFIIGNHADELQPWVPVLTALTGADYLSIPCCAWEFDQRYHMKKRSKKGKNPDNEADEIGGSLEEQELEEKLKHGEPDGSLSLYASYVLWLARLSRQCGFHIESEALRIPSTRNRAIIGRKRLLAEDDAIGKAELRQRMFGIIEDVRKRGLFKSRVPEGKAGLSASDTKEGVVSPGTSGRPREQPDRLFHLKGQDDASAPAVFRPTELGWGRGGTVVGRGRGKISEPRKSRLSS